MSGAIIEASLWVAAIGSGVMAGVYFAFSTFIMRALAAIPRPRAVAAMQSINEVIVSSLFLPLFIVTSLVAAGLALHGAFGWSEPGAPGALVGGVLYFIGMFVCTAAFNVPLNDELADAAPESDEAAALWPDYLRTWTRWNHVRTVASAVACAAFVLAITARI